MSYKVLLCVVIVATLITECYTLSFTRPISKGTVNGRKIKFCEYKLTKMLPKSKILDAEACLSCKCGKKSLKCNDITKMPGCKMMPGGLATQNPFDKEWKDMVDTLVNNNYVGKYQVLQARTQVVAGTNTYLKLLVVDRLCDLEIYTNFKGLSEISEDSCSIGK